MGGRVTQASLSLFVQPRQEANNNKRTVSRGLQAEPGGGRLNPVFVGCTGEPGTPNCQQCKAGNRVVQTYAIQDHLPQYTGYTLAFMGTVETRSATNQPGTSYNHLLTPVTDSSYTASSDRLTACPDPRTTNSAPSSAPCEVVGRICSSGTRLEAFRGR